MMNPPPESHGVVKQGAAQLQTVPQAQLAGQLVVTPLQVTCPRSLAPQSRSTAEQLPVPEVVQLTLVEPVHLAVQVAFVGKGCFAAGAAAAAAAGLASTAGVEGFSPGACAKPATATRATRHARMLVFIFEPPIECSLLYSLSTLPINAVPVHDFA